MGDNAPWQIWPVEFIDLFGVVKGKATVENEHELKADLVARLGGVERPKWHNYTVKQQLNWAVAPLWATQLLLLSHSTRLSRPTATRLLQSCATHCCLTDSVVPK